MKTHIQKFVGLAALGMTLLTTPVPTWAGWTFAPGVTVGTNQLGRFAKGSMVGTRYSADAVQYIACTAIARSTSTQTYCSAADNTGVYLYCTSTDGAIYDTIQSMTDSSFIRIQADSTGSVCTSVNIYNGSEQLK